MIPKINLDLPKGPEKSKVVVAMSGGVDSSTSAALVKASGYSVIGITLQLYNHGAAVNKKGSCCSGQDIYDAREVASDLGIPHYVLDYQDLFKRKVIDDFANSYRIGETPIPCVLCNEKVKFDDLYKTAKDLGADALVTGHYILTNEGKNGRQMFRAKDIEKDQSYFLFKTTKEQLDFLRFPLGSFKKDEIREIAREIGLTVSDKPDSQDICFVPNGKYSEVLKKINPDNLKPGLLLDTIGNVLGNHEGIVNFTIGQRKGLGISSCDPLYVVKIDAENQNVVVGSKEDLKKRNIKIRDMNWIGDEKLGNNSIKEIKIKAKIRSTQEPEPARLCFEHGKVHVNFDDHVEGVSPGQACVFYDFKNSTRVLGGGWITS